MHYEALPLTELLTDKETYRLMDGVNCNDLKDVIKWVEYREGLIFSSPPIPALRIIKFDGRYVGYIYFHNYKFRYNRISVTVAIHKNYRNKGIMTSELRRCIGEIFRFTDIRLITARCFSDNKPACKLLYKAGMIFEGYHEGYIELKDGTLNDEYCFRISRNNWESEMAQREDLCA